MLHLLASSESPLENFWFIHFRSPWQKKSNLDGTLNLRYNFVKILEIWKRSYSCSDLQKSQRRPTSTLCRFRDIKLQTFREGGVLRKIRILLSKSLKVYKLFETDIANIPTCFHWDIVSTSGFMKHFYGSFYVKMAKVFIDFPGNSNIAFIYDCPDWKNL